jgi:hypothetical protein
MRRLQAAICRNGEFVQLYSQVSCRVAIKLKYQQRLHVDILQI